MTIPGIARPERVPAFLVVDAERLEVGGDGNDGTGDLLAEVGLSGLHLLFEDHGEEIFRSLGREKKG